MIASDVRFLRQIADLLPSDAPPRLISEYVQGRRIMPSGTPFPGPWDNSRTPYWVEIMDSMSPFSPIRHGVLMKPRKMGATAIAENIAAYWVDANPTALEYTTATDDLAQDWSTKRWEHVVDSLGFRHKLVAQTNAEEPPHRGQRFQEGVHGRLLRHHLPLLHGRPASGRLPRADQRRDRRRRPDPVTAVRGAGWRSSTATSPLGRAGEDLRLQLPHHRGALRDQPRVQPRRLPQVPRPLPTLRGPRPDPHLPARPAHGPVHQGARLPGAGGHRRQRRLRHQGHLPAEAT